MKYYKQKLGILQGLSFSFLHRVCEDVSQNCDGLEAKDRVPDVLLECSGINDNRSLFFHDRDLAAVGRLLAGPQARTQSPASRGFAACLYPIGTLAKGSENNLYVNLCVPKGRCAPDYGYGKINNVESTNMDQWSRDQLCDIAVYSTGVNLCESIHRGK